MSANKAAVEKLLPLCKDKLNQGDLVSLAVFCDLKCGFKNLCYLVQPPLHAASWQGDQAMVSQLLQAKAEVNLANTRGQVQKRHRQHYKLESQNFLALDCTLLGSAARKEGSS
jgi:hypothetical protein